MYVTDVWDDIRELTSGYFAGEEALRDSEGNRLHKQQMFGMIISYFAGEEAFNSSQELSFLQRTLVMLYLIRLQVQVLPWL